jgi:hypothetical protein
LKDRADVEITWKNRRHHGRQQRNRPGASSSSSLIRSTARPPGDTPSVCPCLRVVGDPREPPAQPDSSRQLFLLIEGSVDRGSIGLSDNEHPNSMAARMVAGKLDVTLPSYGMRPAKRAGRPTSAPGSGWYRLNLLSRLVVASFSVGTVQTLGDHAALAKAGSALENRSNRCPIPAPSVPL